MSAVAAARFVIKRPLAAALGDLANAANSVAAIVAAAASEVGTDVPHKAAKRLKIGQVPDDVIASLASSFAAPAVGIGTTTAKKPTVSFAKDAFVFDGMDTNADHDASSISIGNSTVSNTTILGFDGPHDQVLFEKDSKRASTAAASARPAFVSGTWDQSFRVLQERWKQFEDEEIERKTVHTREQVSDSTFIKSRMCPGDRILANMERELNSLGLVRTQMQRRLHNILTMTQLPFIYGKDFPANQQRLLKQFGVTKFPRAVVCTTPRQFGKTTGMAMYVIVGGRNIPNWKAAQLSPTGRQSENSLNMAWDFGAMFPGGTQRMKRRKEQVYVFSGAAVASRTNKGRGVGGRSKASLGKTIRGTQLVTLDGSKSALQQASEDLESSVRAKAKLDFLPCNEKGYCFVCLFSRVCVFFLVCVVHGVLQTRPLFFVT